MLDNDQPITDLLRAWEHGDTEALQDLMTLVYAKLHQRSRGVLRGERPHHTLSPTALVNEVYLRLASLKGTSWENRTRFFAFAARLMRQVLVEYARAMGAEKRGGDRERIDLKLVELPDHNNPIDFLDLNDALSSLERRDPRLGRIIELRFFAGLNEEEIAEALEISRATVQREWRVGKRLLAALLQRGPVTGKEVMDD
jgi:RNA polymerase sigma-70 factor, ECF subfamily